MHSTENHKKRSDKSNWLGSLEGRQWLLVAARKAQHEKSQKQEIQEIFCKIQKILETTKLTKSNGLVVLMSEKKVRTWSKTLVQSYKRQRVRRNIYLPDINSLIMSDEI